MAVAICWLLAVSTAGALEGYYTEEEIRYPAFGQRAEYTLIRKTWYGDDRMRKEEGWMGAAIARFDQGKVYVLDAPSKTYFAVSADFIQQFAPAGLKAFGALEDEQGKLYFPQDLFVRTDTKRIIGRWECYQVMTNPKYRDPKLPYCIFWYSTEVDFPMELFGEQLKNLMGDRPEIEGLFNRLKQFEGYPVRTEAHGLTSTTITTLYKIERRRDLDPALFEIPKDFTEMPMPEEMPPPRWAP
jgi:hypothetical protein